MTEMSLTAFLDNEYEGNREKFAADIQSSTASLSRYERGERIPNRQTMSLIHKVTGGKVSPNSFYDISAA